MANFMVTGGFGNQSIIDREEAQRRAEMGGTTLGDIRRGIFGPSPGEVQGRRRRQFQDYLAGLNPQQFEAPGLGGTVRGRGMLGQQLGAGGPMAYRPEMGTLVSQLQADAAGRGPGQELVNRQVGGQVQSGIQNQLAMAAGQRGNPLAARTAAMQGANISAQGGQAAAAGSLQAQLAARGQLGQVLGQERAMSQRGQLEALNQQLQAQRMQQAARMGLQQQLFAGNQELAFQQPATNANMQMIGLGMGLGEWAAGAVARTRRSEQGKGEA